MGGSTGVNVAGAIRLAKDLGPGHTIVTVLCDHGSRYQSKLWNPAFLRDKGLPVILISHNMPHVFEIADRIHIARLGKRAAVVNPKKISMSDTVAVMTGAMAASDLPAECLA